MLLPEPATDRRLGRALAFALLLHGAIAAAFLLRPVRAVETYGSPLVGGEDSSVELDVVPLENATIGTAAAAGAGEASGPLATAEPRTNGRSAPRERGTTVVETAEEPGGVAEPFAPGEGAPTVQLVRPDSEAIGLGRRNPLLRGAGGSGESDVSDEARAQADAKRRALAALKAPLEAQDRELGIGPQGPVLMALGDAVSQSTAPVRGRAVLTARVDAAGRVTRLDVADTDGGRAGWTDAARIAMASLGGITLRLPSTAKGAELRIELTSAWKNPSGHDPGTTVTVAGIPITKGEGPQSSQVNVLPLVPKLETIELAPGVKIQIPVAQVGILGGSFDPANAGAQARRVVHTRLLDSTFF